MHIYIAYEIIAKWENYGTVQNFEVMRRRKIGRILKFCSIGKKKKLSFEQIKIIKEHCCYILS